MATLPERLLARGNAVYTGSEGTSSYLVDADTQALLREAAAEIERLTKRANRYRIEADCAMRDVNDLQMDVNLAAERAERAKWELAWARAENQRLREALSDIADSCATRSSRLTDDGQRLYRWPAIAQITDRARAALAEPDEEMT